MITRSPTLSLDAEVSFTLSYRVNSTVTSFLPQCNVIPVWSVNSTPLFLWLLSLFSSSVFTFCLAVYPRLHHTLFSLTQPLYSLTLHSTFYTALSHSHFTSLHPSVPVIILIQFYSATSASVPLEGSVLFQQVCNSLTFQTLVQCCCSHLRKHLGHLRTSEGTGEGWEGGREGSLKDQWVDR